MFYSFVYSFAKYLLSCFQGLVLDADTVVYKKKWHNSQGDSSQVEDRLTSTNKKMSDGDNVCEKSSNRSM